MFSCISIVIQLTAYCLASRVFQCQANSFIQACSLFLQHQLADVKQIDDGSGDFNCDIDSQGAESHDMFIQASIRFLMTLDG